MTKLIIITSELFTGAACGGVLALFWLAGWR